MGCDIHAFFEIKLNGRWVVYSKPFIQRNYVLFAKMANVKNDCGIKPISKPKGLPEDISEVVKFYLKNYHVPFHSYSWLNAKEISEVIKFHRSMDPPEKIFNVDLYEWGFFCGLLWDQYQEKFFPEVEDIRLVFWFDK